MLPVDQVAAGGVSPRHVLPFGAKGVPLVAKVPDAIFIDHTVGIVHPAIERCVVVGGAILLPIGCIKCIADGYVFPAGILLRLTHGGTSLRSDHVQHDMLTLIGSEIEWHIIIYLLCSEAHDDAAFLLAIGQHMDSGLLACVLHGKEQIFALFSHSDKCIIGTQMLNTDPFVFLSGQGGGPKTETSGQPTNLFCDTIHTSNDLLIMISIDVAKLCKSCEESL